MVRKNVLSFLLLTPVFMALNSYAREANSLVKVTSNKASVTTKTAFDAGKYARLDLMTALSTALPKRNLVESISSATANKLTSDATNKFKQENTNYFIVSFAQETKLPPMMFKGEAVRLDCETSDIVCSPYVKFDVTGPVATYGFFDTAYSVEELIDQKYKLSISASPNSKVFDSKELVYTSDFEVTSTRFFEHIARLQNLFGLKKTTTRIELNKTQDSLSQSDILTGIAKTLVDLNTELAQTEVSNKNEGQK